MDTRTTRMLARYNAWANKTLFDAVAVLPPGEAIKERASLFANMVHTLNHLYVVDLIWQAHLQGRDHGSHVRPSVTPLGSWAVPLRRASPRSASAAGG